LTLARRRRVSKNECNREVAGAIRPPRVEPKTGSAELQLEQGFGPRSRVLERENEVRG
jgi:hypothetical protein